MLSSLPRRLLGFPRSWRSIEIAIAFILALSSVMSVLAPVEASGPTSGPPRVYPRLLVEADAHPNQTYRVIITRQVGNHLADTLVATHGGRKIENVGTLGFAATVTGKELATLGRDASIRFIAPDAKMQSVSTIDSGQLATLYPPTVGAPRAWSNGLTGQGVGVAVIDTGINGLLPDFHDGLLQSRVINSVLFNPLLSSTGDQMGHGTMVAGVIGGNSWNNPVPSVQGKYIGIAPGANLINVRVADAFGETYTSDVVNAINWVVANRQTDNIRVINLSLISTVPESYTTSLLDAAVEYAWFNGIFVVTAAGNAGPNTELYAPANDPFVVTVGAGDTMGTTNPADDTIAPWSSYGTTQDGFSKPDLVAPGRQIIAPLASLSCTLARQFPDRIVDHQYIWMSGTSLSAPVVSGMAAVLFQGHPEYTNDTVKWLLTHTATPLGATNQQFTPYPGSGAGEASLSVALSYDGSLQTANQGIPINHLLVGPNGATTYSTSSWSTSSWSTSSWSTSSWSTSSWSTSSWSTSSWSTTAPSSSSSVLPHLTTSSWTAAG